MLLGQTNDYLESGNQTECREMAQQTHQSLNRSSLCSFHPKVCLSMPVNARDSHLQETKPFDIPCNFPVVI